MNSRRRQLRKIFKNPKRFSFSQIFNASELTDRTPDKTALCPYCGIDSVVQDYNVKITPKLLKKMNAEWFGGLG